MPEYAGEVTHVELANVPLWFIALAPFLGAAFNALFGRRLQASSFGKARSKAWHIGSFGVTAVAVAAMAIAFLLTAVSFIQLLTLEAGDRYIYTHAWQMARIGSLDISFSFAMDTLSGLMTMIITGVGSLIHIYAASYMEKEPAYWRFFTYLNLFVFAMLLLVLGDNFIVMFFGWEGVGLCSYCLIGFWYKDYKKATAGMKAFVVNRVGDWGFICGVALLFWGLGGAWLVADGGYIPDFAERFAPVRVKALAMHGGHHGDDHGDGAHGDDHADHPEGAHSDASGFALINEAHAHPGHRPGEHDHEKGEHAHDDGHGHGKGHGAGDDHGHGHGHGSGQGRGAGKGTGAGANRTPGSGGGGTRGGIAINTGELGTLTMTTHPGAKVYFGVTDLQQLAKQRASYDRCNDRSNWNASEGAQISVDCYAEAPFVRKRLPSGPHSIAIVPEGGAVVTGDGNEMAVFDMRVWPGEETLIATVGPTLTFREIHDQMVMVGNGRAKFSGASHTHYFELPASEMGEGGMRVFKIAGNDHDHLLHFTDEQMKTVADGGQVELETSAGADGHVHKVVVDRPFWLKENLKSKSAWGIGLVTLACLLFFVGATGKSAQIPLYVWLPDAMAGPTPVSALIHAATMVTAGVYMITRLNFLFGLTPTASGVVALVGALTALFAATMGFFQYDIKKVLAYSTVSQLGFMFIGVGVGAYWAGVFHLMTHAFFKACLFLASGSVIHGMHHLIHDEVGSQDMRNMGGLRAVMPKTAKTYWFACMAITAVPPGLAGFWSKDEILWKAFNTEHTAFVPGWVIYTLGLLAALGTSFYMWRSYYLTFEGKHAHREIPKKVHESPSAMTTVLWILAGLSIVSGVTLGLSSHFTGGIGEGILPHEPLMEQWLHPVTAHTDAQIGDAGYFAMYGLMALSVVGAIGAWGLARLKYGADRPKDWAERERRLPGWELLHNKYYVDEIYDGTIVALFMRSRIVMAEMDRWIVDGVVNGAGALGRGAAWVTGAIDRMIVDGAVNFVAEGLLKAGQKLRGMQTGRVQNYVYGILGGVAFLAIIQYFFG